MERPFAVIRSRAHVRRAGLQPAFILFAHVRLLLILFFIFALLLPATPVRAATSIWLPTPVGERWKIIQGYGCGTHNSWDRFALDLVSADGKTYGAPARAAADGSVVVWEARSGTIILSHGDTFYTQYTHLASAAVRVGDNVKRGGVVGTVGDRGTAGNPHLHFHAYTSSSAWGREKKTVPLSFAEGYEFPETRGCSQHQGETVVAGETSGVALSGVRFSSEAQPNQWYNRDISIAFQGQGMARGFSASWDSEPAGDSPASGADQPGLAQLAARGEGLHTLYVRGWDANGQQSLTSYGPIGYDATAPNPAASVETQTVAANDAGAIINWNAAQDAASGIAGYKVYIGPDANGMADWFVPTNAASSPLAPGNHTLRVQPIDYAGNSAAWVTVGIVVAK